MIPERIDKWLWQARFVKSRSLSATLIKEGKIRVNGSKISKPSHKVEIGDNLVFSLSEWMRKIEVVKMGVRRGPASEAQELYLDHSEPRPIREKIPENPKYEGKGRPTGKWRRALHSFSNSGLD
ncbi:RNA-binding S4 domain-containing protein [Amylibacter sp.]|nr:RNA-binding S4 domain-containing protein [Amylibacter sp.]